MFLQGLAFGEGCALVAWYGSVFWRPGNGFDLGLSRMLGVRHLAVSKAEIITDTIYGVSFYEYSVIYPKTLF